MPEPRSSLLLQDGSLFQDVLAQSRHLRIEEASKMFLLNELDMSASETLLEFNLAPLSRGYWYVRPFAPCYFR